MATINETRRRAARLAELHQWICQNAADTNEAAWLTVVPDGATTEDFEDIAKYDEDYAHALTTASMIMHSEIGNARREQLNDISTKMFRTFDPTQAIPATKVEAYERWERTLTRDRADEILDLLEESVNYADIDEYGNGETNSDRLWDEILDKWI